MSIIVPYISEKSKIYLNPADNFIQIHTNENIQAIHLTDISGRIIPISLKFSNDKIIINTKHLNSGIYWLYILINNKIYVEKVIVLH